MDVFAWIVGIFLAVAFSAAGIAKLLDVDPARRRFGYTRRQYLALGACEVLGAAALIVGLVWRKLEWIGLGAAVGLLCVLLGALMAHARVGDEGRKIIPAVVLMVVAVAYLVSVSLR